MKKYFLSLFIFNLLFSLIFASQPQRTFAAGEVYTWQANGSISVTGGNLKNPGTIPQNAEGFLDITDPNGTNGFCVLPVLPVLAADNKSAVLSAGLNLPSNHPKNACPASIANPYYTTIQIGGTPPGAGGTTGGICTGTAVTITYYDTNFPPTPPSTITFVIGNQKQAAKSSRENDAFGDNYSYTAAFCLNPGKYTVSGSPLLSSCQSFKNFTKKANTPLALTCGNRLNTSVINIVANLLDTDPPGPYSVQLKQNGKVIQTVQTSKAGNQGTACSLVLQATLDKVNPGSYQVCIQLTGSISKLSTCQDVQQVAGQAGSANFSIDNVETNGNNPCLTGAPTPLPPPPSPPCIQWQGGQCTSFSSALGAFTTDPSGFIQKIFAILLSISGGIALLLIIRAGYQLMVSQGKPEQIQQGRDQLIAAIVGLVFLIFSFVFLQLIGFDILHIPGFTGSTSNSPNGPQCQPGSCIQSSLCNAKNPGHCNNNPTNGCPGGEVCVQQ